MELAGSFKPRSFRFLAQWQMGAWRLKAYGITYGADLPAARLVKSAELYIASKIQAWCGEMGGYGVGFVGIHDGRGYDVVFLDWWVHQNELRHEMFVSPKGGAIAFKPVAEKAPKVCVWDLHLQYFERQAWVETAMKSGDLEAYLGRRCQAMA